MYVQLPNGNMTSSSPNVTQVYREGASGGTGGKGVTYSKLSIPIPGAYNSKEKRCSFLLTTIAENPK